MLYVVPTPIGNLKDMSQRALEVLNSVDIILCEDTRKTLILLNNFNISKPLVSYHKFNEKKSCEKIIKLLKDDKNIALVSDCGTPLISDPGQILIEELNKNNLPYTVLPGPCAFVTALVLSGFDSTKFSFFGFLPEKQKARTTLLNSIKNLETTLIFHISVHSLQNDLKTFYDTFGKRKACLVREISKIYEEKIYFNLGEDFEFTQKGEFIIIIEGSNNIEKTLSPRENYELLISQGMKKNQAIRKTAKEYNLDSNDFYKQINNIK